MDRRALYNLFSQQFPIDKLGNMTIEEYTNLDKKDSFCYWLESKTYELGSIWGGSAYKFGIFKFDKTPDKDNTKYAHDDKYSWSSRLGSTSEEAFKNVRNAIVKIANHARKAEWDEIEKSTELWPVTTWKIAFLYSNEQLLPIYDKEDFLAPIATYLGLSNANKCSRAKLYRFLLEKKGDKDLYEFYDELLAINRKVWLFDSKYEPFKSNEIAMGDSVQMSDFSQFKSKEALRKAYQEKKGNTDVSIPNAYWQFMKEVNIGDIIVAYDGVKDDSGVYHKLCGWGIFTSDIIYENGANPLIKRNVSWKKNISDAPIICRETKNQLFFHKANSKQAQVIIKLLGIPEETTSTQPLENNNMEYQKYIDILKNCHNLVLTGAPGTGKTYLAREIAKQMNAETEFVQFHPSYDYSDFVEGLRPVQSADNQIGFERKDGIFKAFCAKALKNLQDSKKSIETLEKESSTRQIVEDFINDAIENNTEFATSGTKNKFKIIDNKESVFLIDVPANKTSTLSLSKSVIITLLNENKVINGGKDIQEHFERTYRTQQDSYYYVLLNEIKKVHKASQPSSKQKVESKNFVFIIDEINRGEVSKIFGELFYAIDPGYRNDGNGKDSVKTQYQNLVQEDDVFYKGFFVPSNVYIIATMNDIDRSVESMDFAMRRRFCWLEVKPEERKAMLEILGNFKNEAINRMDALNKAITNEESLGSAFQIGPAYFLKLNNGDFNTLWEMHLEPLLREYLRGFRNADEKLKTFKSSFELQQTSLTNNDITEG